MLILNFFAASKINNPETYLLVAIIPSSEKNIHYLQPIFIGKYPSSKIN
jgi:hypothetical protein